MKKILIIIVLFITSVSFAQGPEFELYTGLITPKPANTTLGYMVGLNLTPNLFQIDKHDSTKKREYLNKFLIGIGFSGYQTKPISITIEPNTQLPTQEVDCNCTASSIDGISSGGNYVSKQDVTGLGINFGVEVYKGWFVLAGVINYNHRNILNNETISTYRTTYIDAGIKKFIHIGNTYWSPMIKTNKEATSFGIGFSFD